MPAPTVMATLAFGRVPALHRTVEGLRVHSRAAVSDANLQRPARLPHSHFDSGIIAAAGVQRVVDQIAHHRDDLLRAQRRIVESDGNWVSSVMVSAMPRSCAWGALPGRSATRAGSRTASDSRLTSR
jgi:hypothetical protein